MSDFDFLNQLHVAGDDTSEMTLYQLRLPNGKHPTLIGRFAGESNKSYTNAILKRGVKQQKIIRTGNIDVEILKANRDHDRALFPAHVLVGWKDVCDKNGKDKKFSPEACADFITHLPDDMFDEVRNHFGEPSNFRQEVDTEDAIEKGNS